MGRQGDGKRGRGKISAWERKHERKREREREREREPHTERAPKEVRGQHIESEREL